MVLCFRFDLVNVMLTNKKGGRKKRVGFLAYKVDAVWRQAGLQTACGRWWTTSFALLVFFSPSFLYLLSCMNFDLWVFSHLLLLLSLIPLQAGQRCVSEWLCGHLAADYSQPTISDKYNPLKRDMCGITFISKAFQAMSVSVATTTQRMLPSVSSWQFSRSCCPAEHNPGMASSGPLTPPQLTPVIEQKNALFAQLKRVSCSAWLTQSNRRVLELISIYSCIHLVCTRTKILSAKEENGHWLWRAFWFSYSTIIWKYENVGFVKHNCFLDDRNINKGCKILQGYSS